MSLLSREYLITSLRTLQPTQENMQTMALYIRTNRCEHEKILEIYRCEVIGSNVFHQLNLYYLANEVLQNEKKALKLEGLYCDLKKAVLVHFSTSKAEASRYPRLFEKYCGLEDVWIQREIFLREELGSLDIQEDESSRHVLPETLITKEEVLSKINELFGSKKDLVEYLKKLIMHLDTE